MPTKRGPMSPREVALARNETREAWRRATEETRGAAKMSATHPPVEVEVLAYDLCVRAFAGLSIEARERLARLLAERYIPAAANSPHSATVRSHGERSTR